jgi:hypothetical protein
VVREGVGAGGEMNQALYAHMNNKRKIKKKKKRQKQQKNPTEMYFSYNSSIKKSEVRVFYFW